MENNEQKISTSLLLLNIVMVFAVISIVFFIYGRLHSSEPKRLEREGKITTQSGQVISQELKLDAKAVYVYDISTKTVLYKKNETIQLPLASLTKLMTALVAVELAPQNTHVSIKKDFLTTEGDSGLLANETWKLKDLLDFSLIVSSNDGVRSVASVIGATAFSTDDYSIGRKDFIQKMNEEAKILGMSEMYFVNESGLDENTNQSGGYGTAQNIAQLLEHILRTHPDILEATKYKNTTISSLSKNHTIKNTNSDIGNIPGLLASKTGYTDLAGGNLAVVFDAGLNRPVIAVVLGSTQNGRFSDINTLVQASLESLKQ
jgi:D-alanyl-D-alanine carboxypeptidase